MNGRSIIKIKFSCLSREALKLESWENVISTAVADKELVDVSLGGKRKEKKGWKFIVIVAARNVYEKRTGH